MTKTVHALITDPRKFPDSPVCSCDVCKTMCERPCWPFPEEAQALITAGYGDRLMLDWWCDDEDIYLLCPANKGNEGSISNSCPRGKLCTFSNDGGLCELHDLKLKPIEGRVAYHSSYNTLNCDICNMHEHVAMTWNNPKAQKIVRDWKEKYGF